VTQSPPHLSVVIPCYNEQRNLELGVLDEVLDYLSRAPFTWEVIVVDDESTDDSLRLVEAFCERHDGFRHRRIPHGGKPAAVFAGIERARGEIVLFTDMDQSTPIEEFERLHPWFERGYDVVIGSRGTARDGFSVLRRAGSSAFRMLRRSLVLGEIEDTQCGFKACRREAALVCFPKLQFFATDERPSGWRVSAFDVELLYLFRRAGYAIREVEVRWWNRDRSDTKAQMGEVRRYVHESREMLVEVLRIKLNEVRGLYD